MEVSVDELRTVSRLLFDHLEEIGYSTVPIKDDYYWWIPDDALYNLESEPKEFGVGQLSDDLQELRAIAGNERDPSALALAWLSAVLRYVGESVVR